MLEGSVQLFTKHSELTGGWNFPIFCPSSYALGSQPVVEFFGLFKNTEREREREREILCEYGFRFNPRSHSLAGM